MLSFTHVLVPVLCLLATAAPTRAIDILGAVTGAANTAGSAVGDFAGDTVGKISEQVIEAVKPKVVEMAKEQVDKYKAAFLTGRNLGLYIVLPILLVFFLGIVVNIFAIGLCMRMFPRFFRTSPTGPAGGSKFGGATYADPTPYTYNTDPAPNTSPYGNGMAREAPFNSSETTLGSSNADIEKHIERVPVPTLPGDELRSSHDYVETEYNAYRK